MKIKAFCVLLFLILLVTCGITMNVGAEGFGQVQGYVYKGMLPVKGVDVQAVSAFGEYSTKTDWKGFYSLGPLELSKKGFANYDIIINSKFGDNTTTIHVDGLEWHN